MSECVFCGVQTSEGAPTAKLTKKGCDGILKANEQHNACITIVPGQVVHVKCRSKFINKNEIDLFRKRKQDTGVVEVGCKRRSSGPSFSYRDHCLFCGLHDRYSGKKKEFKLISVRTKDFETNIIDCCIKHSDHWSD